MPKNNFEPEVNGHLRSDNIITRSQLGAFLAKCQKVAHRIVFHVAANAKNHMSRK